MTSGRVLPSGFVASQRLAQPKAPNSVARKNICPASGDVTPCGPPASALGGSRARVHRQQSRACTSTVSQPDTNCITSSRRAHRRRDTAESVRGAHAVAGRTGTEARHAGLFGGGGEAPYRARAAPPTEQSSAPHRRRPLLVPQPSSVNCWAESCLQRRMRAGELPRSLKSAHSISDCALTASEA